MIKFILKRFIIAIPLLFVITFISFCVIQLTPGNYFDRFRVDPRISESTIQVEEAKYHLNESVPVQYFHWLKNIFKFDLGYSFSTYSPVSSVIGARLFNTLLLSLSSFLFAWLIAIPLGIYSAVHPNKFSDRFLSFFAFIGLSIPNFFAAP